MHAIPSPLPTAPPLGLPPAAQGKSYAAIEVPADLGLDCQRYKWRQNQSHVEVFIPLPPGVPASKVGGGKAAAAPTWWGGPGWDGWPPWPSGLRLFRQQPAARAPSCAALLRHAAQVCVELSPTSLAVSVDEQPLLAGALYHEIKRDESTWYCQASRPSPPRGGAPVGPCRLWALHHRGRGAAWPTTDRCAGGGSPRVQRDRALLSPQI